MYSLLCKLVLTLTGTFLTDVIYRSLRYSHLVGKSETLDVATVLLLLIAHIVHRKESERIEKKG